MKFKKLLTVKYLLSNYVMSRDGTAASERVTTCTSTHKFTLMNTLFIRNTTPYISEKRVFWLKYGF